MTSSFKQGERGAVLIEHVLVLPVFFLLLLGSLEFLRIMYNQLSIQFAVSEASRRAVVRDASASMSEVRNDIAARLRSLGIPLDASDVITVCPIGRVDACRTASNNWQQDYYERGRPSEQLVFEMRRSVSAAYFSRINLTARVFAKNEPES